MIIDKPLTKGAFAQKPRRAIIHSMAEFLHYEGKVIHATDFLEKIGLSAHILIAPNGDILRCRNNHQGAYHAKNNNENTVGAEWLVEGIHDYASFKETIKTDYLTPQQYTAGVDYIRQDWVINEGILNFARHSDIDPDRKVDPGDGFLWTKFLQDIGVIWRR